MILAAVTVRCPSNDRHASSTSGLLAPASQSSTGRAACSYLPWPAVLPQRPHRPYYSHRWPVHPSTHPHPLLFCGDGSLTPQRTSEPSYSSTRGHPVPHLPRLLVVPFLGLTVVHRPGALSAAWSTLSTWSRNDFHRTWTVRGEADSWVHGRSKEVPPYYAENNDSPPDSWDPLDGPLYFTKKTFSPDCWDPPATSSHARKCVRAEKQNDSPP